MNDLNHTKVVWRLIIVQGDQGNVSATLSFMESSYFPVFISYIYQIVLLQQATIKKNGPSKSSVSVLSLTVYCIYTGLQIRYNFSKSDDSGNSTEICPLSF